MSSAVSRGCLAVVHTSLLLYLIIHLQTAFTKFHDEPRGTKRGNNGGNRVSHFYNFPPPKVLPVNVMKEKLGKDLNLEFSSWEQRRNSTLSPRRAPPRNSEIHQEIQRYMNNLDFTYEDERGNIQNMRAEVRKVLERWLLTQHESSCRVRQTWYDMGPMFWPRYIKQGECEDDDGSANNVPTCSWPPGMHCVAAKSHIIRLLNWNCRRQDDVKHLASWKRHKRSSTGDVQKLDKSNHRQVKFRKFKRSQSSQQSQMKCKWKKIPYPITKECFCSC
ncbi:hypothetical protein HELRODRAFT_154266 [Helobdella robusta]|uniref:Noggin n=1 Tax=Helobdella robusta TaxID=6412 RepID=T1ELE3_HELRO|nr:hypothetical protein HELRODRAFT_154266 [Helobdella robusta]ESN94637.1 hypothetical protein HELRODRAFT_154266 [Helobdella robusta]